jgi:hypothetical protein
LFGRNPAQKIRGTAGRKWDHHRYRATWKAGFSLRQICCCRKQNGWDDRGHDDRGLQHDLEML